MTARVSSLTACCHQTRTTLAAIRTLFTYLELTALSVGWSVALVSTEMAMASLVVLLAATGAWRYFRIKHIVNQKVAPPRAPPRVPHSAGPPTQRPSALHCICAHASHSGVHRGGGCRYHRAPLAG